MTKVRPHTKTNKNNGGNSRQIGEEAINLTYNTQEIKKGREDGRTHSTQHINIKKGEVQR